MVAGRTVTLRSIALVALLSACAAHSPSEVDDPFWSVLRVHGDETEGYATLSEMKTAADATVVGRIASVGLERQLHGDATEDQVFYVSVVLDVEEVLAGVTEGDRVPIEFLLAAPDAETADALVASLASSLPTDLALVFLRAKSGQGEEGLYRLVNSDGLWMKTDRAGVDTPQAVEAAHHYPELGSAGSLEALIEVVRGL